MKPTITHNINVTTSPITTIFGGILILIAITLYVLPLFVDLKSKTDWYVDLGIGLFGFSLLLIPDDLKGALARLINKKADQI